jgi:cold shock CspA family protein
VEPLDSAYERFKAFVEKVGAPGFWDSVKSEADVRMKIVDPIFMEILGWPLTDIHCESQAGKNFIDYRGTIKGLNRLIIEAKKEARDLGINETHAGRYFKLNGAVFHTEAAREGIDQAIRYCGHKNVELACLTNGQQWAVFRGRAREGTDTMENVACVFGSLEAVGKKFQEFYGLLAYENVQAGTFRAVFRQAENQPVRQMTVKAIARPPDSREMLRSDKLYADLEKIMHSFFRDLDSIEDDEARRACFVTTTESAAAERGLERISEELRRKVQDLDTAESAELTEVVKRVKEMQRNELVLLVGTKGAGKTTFIDRFFADVLPPAIREDCVVVRLDLSKTGGDKGNLTRWLDEHFLAELEKATFKSGYPTYEELMGMCMGEYKRWSEGHRKYLYDSDKLKFKDEFGKHIETYYRQDRPKEYITHLLFHIVRNHKRIPCIVFDNADHFDVDFQEAAFNYAHSICSESICLMILPITDTTSWQLPKQGGMQSFFSDSFFLPTPPTEMILKRRIEYIEKKIADEQAETGKKPGGGRGYFFSRNIRLEIDNIQGFAACLQTVFVNTGQVADWIGKLANHDIRRALQLTCEIVTSPYIPIPELCAAWVSRSTMNVDPDVVKTAIIRGKYNIYCSRSSAFVQNLYTLASEHETTPLLAIRVLRFLADAWESNTESDLRYVPASDVLGYFEAMGIDLRAVSACLDQMMERGLCLGYDPRAKKIDEATKVEIAPSGRQHLMWALRDWIYMSAMAEITPLHDVTAVELIRECIRGESPHLRRQIIMAFVNNLVSEDSQFCVVPKHVSYDSQQSIIGTLSEQVASLSTLAGISGAGTRFHRHIGKVVSWKSTQGYGFVQETGCDSDIYLSIHDVLDRTIRDVPEGTFVEYDTVVAERGPKAVSVVVLC